jgi:hypothetical protein
MHWISNSAKVLLKKVGPGTLLALLGAVTIYMIASDGFTRKTVATSKASVDVPAAGLRKDSQGAPADDRNMATPGLVVQDAHDADHRAIAEKNSAIEQTPAPVLTPPPTPAVGRNAFAIDSEFLKGQQPDVEPKNLEGQSTEAERKKSEKQPTEAERKSLERKRKEAERKRARLEAMYQKHLISSDAYKKGEEKYKSEIEKYRSAVNAGRVPENES